MFGIGIHFAECLCSIGGEKNCIIAEAVIAPWRPDQHTVDAALEGFTMSVGPTQRKRADETRIPVTLPGNGVLDPLHGRGKILGWPGPTGGINPRGTTQGGDCEPGIISQRRQIGGQACGAGL